MDETPAQLPTRARVYHVLVAIADPELREYARQCVGRIPGVELLDSPTGGRPAVIVCDESNAGRGAEAAGGVPRLVVLDEPPEGGTMRDAFILTPFDARDMARAVLRLFSG